MYEWIALTRLPFKAKWSKTDTPCDILCVYCLPWPQCFLTKGVPTMWIWGVLFCTCSRVMPESWFVHLPCLLIYSLTWLALQSWMLSVLWKGQQGSVVTSVEVGSPQVHRQPLRKLHFPTGRRKIAKFLGILRCSYVLILRWEHMKIVGSSKERERGEG